MNSRNKSAVNGFRSKTTGFSSDYSGRTHTFHNSEHRSFNSHGHGQGQTGRYKSGHLQAPLFQKGDILMEAGRLAAEYLVSKGSLPSSSLPGKWQNGYSSKQIDDDQDTRATTHSRNSGFDLVSGGKENSFNGNSKIHCRGRTRGDIYGNHASEWSREYGRSGELSEKNKGNSDMEGDDNTGLNVRENNFHLSSVYDNSDKSNGDLKQGDNSDNLLVDDPDFSEGRITYSKHQDVKEKSVDCGLVNEKPDNSQDVVPEEMVTDLAKLCKFGKVPTRLRSAIISRTSKEEQVMADLKQINMDPNDRIVEHMSSSFEISEDVTESTDIKGKFLRSESFPTVENEQETVDKISSFGRSSSLKERGEKRKLVSNDTNETVKKTWLSTLTTSDSSIDHQARKNSDDNVIIASIMGEIVPNTGFYDNANISTSSNYSEEKKVFPSLYKICDLNLMETSSVNDHPVLYSENEGAQIESDLSISSNIPNENVTHSSTRKEIEVIDLEDTSIPDARKLKNPETNAENFCNSSQGLAIQSSDAKEITDIQDSYDGLMMSEFLNTFSNSPSTNGEINPLQNGIGFHNGQVPLGDDDSIYMSLEEISFMPTWQQPTPQEYEKSFQ